MFDWREFLELAESLATSGGESSLRTAISRSYYCAYHAATSTAHARSLFIPSQHRVWNQYQLLGRERGRYDLSVIGELGRELKRWREVADYHALFDRNDRSVSLIAIVTQDILIETRELLRLLKAL